MSTYAVIEYRDICKITINIEIIVGKMNVMLDERELYGKEY